MNTVHAEVATSVDASLARQYAEFVSDLDLNHIPSSVRIRAKHLMLDSIGIAFASGTFEFARTAEAGITAMAEPGSATVIGRSGQIPFRDAALLNGILVHGLDYDDTHVPGVIHATASVLPTVLALGERLGSSGREILLAYIIGAELGARIASVPQGGFHKLGFHPTGLIGAFGSVLAAARLLRLSPEQTTMAQGIVLSMAAGSMEFLDEGAWTKRMHPGWAAHSAINAAYLAKHGFVGPTKPYEGRFGLYATHVAPGSDCNFDLATSELGAAWEISKIAVKPFPACHFVHACADAALILAADHDLQAQDIASVRALVPEQVIPTVCEPVENKLRPVSDYDAKFSLQFAVGASIVRRQFGLAELEPDALADRDVLAVAAKVTHEVDPDSPFPQAYSGELVIETTDGRTLRHREHINRGADERPLSNAEISKKYEENALIAISPDQMVRVRDSMLDIESLADITHFTETLRCV
ncbi:MAG: MmgE/PrpD family protein [Gammaproteobacteria bacterium]|nr:MmgE/PrpD family protein [Gammaproteobacteria bacterium]